MKFNYCKFWTNSFIRNFQWISLDVVQREITIQFQAISLILRVSKGNFLSERKSYSRFFNRTKEFIVVATIEKDDSNFSSVYDSN